MDMTNTTSFVNQNISNCLESWNYAHLFFLKDIFSLFTFEELNLGDFVTILR